MREAVVVNVVRTPVGRMGQSLAKINAAKLGALAITEAVKRSKIAPEEIDEVMFCNLFNVDAGNMARLAWLEAGLPISVPAISLDRQCSSSLNAMAYASILINSGNADVVLTGGVESYSQSPFMIARPEKACPSELKLIIKACSTEEVGNPPMIVTAENIATKYKLTREECDEFALRSHVLASESWRKGKFNEQVFPVTIPQKKGNNIVVDMDDCVRSDCSMQGLAKLRPIVKPDGVVTAGNSSPMNDGASASILMEKQKALSLGLKPLVKIKAFASAGCDPNLMGLGPVYSTRKLLNKTGLKINDIDLVEINEAFASQTLACVKELGIDITRLNVNGGSISIGHPNAASGCIVGGRLIYEMIARGSKYGLVTFCCGGGQGFSVLFESVK